MTPGNVERRKPKWYHWVLQVVFPTIILGVVSWAAGNVVEMKVQFREANAQIVGKINVVEETVRGMRQDLAEEKAAGMKNSALHHRTLVSACTGCHAK
jgi:hypothetical protein